MIFPGLLLLLGWGGGPHVRCQIWIRPGKEEIQLCPGNSSLKKVGM